MAAEEVDLEVEEEEEFGREDESESDNGILCSESFVNMFVVLRGFKVCFFFCSSTNRVREGGVVLWAFVPFVFTSWWNSKLFSFGSKYGLGLNSFFMPFRNEGNGICTFVFSIWEKLKMICV